MMKTIKFNLLAIILILFNYTVCASEFDKFEFLPIILPSDDFHRIYSEIGFNDKKLRNVSINLYNSKQDNRIEFTNQKNTFRNNVNNLKSYNSKLSYEKFFRDINKFKPSFVSKISFNEKILLNCYENSRFIIVGADSNCEPGGKKKLNSNKIYPIESQTNLISLGLGLKKNFINWNQKSTVKFRINSKFIDQNIKIDPIIILSEKFDKNTLQNKNWFLISPKISATRSNILNNSWSLGYGIEYSYNKSINLYNKISRNNISLVLKLTKKLNDQIFINLGTKYETTSIDTLLESGFYDISPIKTNKAYKKIYLSVNFFKNIKHNFQNERIIETLNLNLNEIKMNKKLLRSTIKNKTNKVVSPLDNKKSSNLKTNSKKAQLIDYALLYAKTYDKI